MGFSSLLCLGYATPLPPLTPVGHGGLDKSGELAISNFW